MAIMNKLLKNDDESIAELSDDDSQSSYKSSAVVTETDEDENGHIDAEKGGI